MREDILRIMNADESLKDAEMIFNETMKSELKFFIYERLEGSSKQKSWCLQIIQSKYDELNDDVEKILYLEEIKKNTSAAWWIASRNQTLKDLFAIDVDIEKAAKVWADNYF